MRRGQASRRASLSTSNLRCCFVEERGCVVMVEASPRRVYMAYDDTDFKIRLSSSRKRFFSLQDDLGDM